MCFVRVVHVFTSNTPEIFDIHSSRYPFILYIVFKSLEELADDIKAEVEYFKRFLSFNSNFYFFTPSVCRICFGCVYLSFQPAKLMICFVTYLSKV